MATPVEAQEELHNGGSMQLQGIANFETRKKRRESSHRPESVRSHASDDFGFERVLPGEVATITAQPLKAGAKRKLNIREDDNMYETTKVTEQETFKLDHRSSNPIFTEAVKESKTLGSKDLANLDISQHQAIKHQSSSSYQEKAKHSAPSSAPRSRKALGPSMWRPHMRSKWSS